MLEYDFLKRLLQAHFHYVKSVRIFSFSGTYFPAFVLNMDQKNSEYGHFSHSVQYLALHPIGLLSDCSARVALSPKVMATPEICVQVLCLYINY